MSIRCFFASMVLAGSLLSAASPAAAENITGAGSTFVQPILTKWTADYSKRGSGTVAYQAVGSSAGIEAIQAGKVDFGATDKPLSPADVDKYGLIQFPVVVGAVVPVFNLPGISAGKIRFSGHVLADIFQKKITRWNDAAIAALNPRVQLPAMPITVVHRSDGSGTSYNFTDFLALSSKDWRDNVGVGLTVNWPTGLGGKGNGGVAELVRNTAGAIGYVEYSYALQNKLAHAQVLNTFGLTVSPSPETIEAAASTVDWSLTKHFSALMTNARGTNAYPIAASTFVLMRKNPTDKARNGAVLRFFNWTLEEGEQQAADLNYVAIPPKTVFRIKSYWSQQVAWSATQIAGMK